VSYPRNKDADIIERMLLSFDPLKNIVSASKAQPKHIRARANRMGLRKQYITDSEKELLAQLRRETKVP
jgi:hypothetical protein